MLKLQITLRRAIPCACALLVACAAAPQAEKHGHPLPAYYPAAQTPPSAQATAAASLGWKNLFVDPYLQGLISNALAYNSDLQVASARVAEAKALYGIQDANRWPMVAVGAEAGRARKPADLSPVRKTLLGSQYQVGFSLASYELDFWGRVSSLNEVALAQFLASAEAKQAFQISLIALVSNSYLQDLELAERLSLAEKTLASREESLRIMQRRVDVGSASDLVLRQAQVLMFSTRSELAVLKRQQAQNTALLAQLTGHADLPRTTHLALDQQGLEREIAAGLPSDLLLQRPDLRAAEQKLKASRANVNAARAAFFPSITLTGMAGMASSDLDRLFSSGQQVWSFLPQISLPLFDAGLTQHNLDLAEARKHLAVANYESTVRSAFRDVSNALAAQHWLTVQLAEQTELVKFEAERTRLADLRYEHGAITYLEVLDAKRALFSAEQALVQLRRARLSSTVDLYVAVGGGQDELLTPAGKKEEK
ncbi:MAG: efflux transporter outer membrane subunit [Proteobacteria bacterium]|nr:efflux transporter outer membrane subunit [Pseudomonadota bacterium]